MSVFTTNGNIKVKYGDEIKEVEPPLDVQTLKSIAREFGVKKFKVARNGEYLTAEDFPIESEAVLEIIPVDGWGC